MSMRKCSAGSPMEPLEGRVMLAAHPLDAHKHAEALTRVNTNLLNLYDSVVGGQRAAEAAKAHHLRVDARERVGVTIRAANVAKVTKGLEALGFVATASFPNLNFVEGLLPVRVLRAVGKIASRLGQFAILPSYAPVSFAGAVTSQADGVMEADRVRGNPALPASINGAGFKVGVLSDSYNMLGGAGADIASGDLPAGVQVIQEGPAGSSDEGRAMMQLIHDLAPGASLAFATAFTGQGGFANNIRALANPAIGNAKIIVDDVGYFEEPMFQDGVIAQAIDEVVITRGVTYFSAAGNQAGRAYESTAFSTASDSITLPNSGGTLTGNFYDFNSGAGVDTRQRLTLPGNGELRLTFQWDDPFYTLSGVDTDLDLYLIDAATGQVVASAVSNNIASQQPVEVLQYANGGAAAQTLDLVIFKSAGPDSGRIKYVNYGSAGLVINEYATNSPTIVPHAAAANGQAVAAVAYFNQTAPQAFTSNGPSTILFSPAGVRLATPEVRQGPDIAAIDGVNNTFFGSDFEGDGRPNFFGTSAAAPHAAAVAALVRQANPTFTPQQVYTRLHQTADDITSSGAGFDNVTGHGLINAYDAVYPTIAPATVNFFDGFEGGVLSAAYETRSTGNGRLMVTNANGPATGARHVTMDTSLLTGGFGLNELILHVDASGSGDKVLSFRQREFDGDEDHVMPASFSGSHNSDGVALSVDGVTWFRLVSLTGAASTATYAQHTFNLSAAAAAAGITLTSDTRIKFQQYDDSPIGLGDGMAFDELRVTDADLPVVTGVFVNGSAWTSSFRDFLASSGQGDATHGYRLDASNHADELPWTNLNQVSVRFSEGVNVTADDLVLRGVRVAEYAGLAMTYNPSTFTATWTLPAGATFAADKLLLDLNADAGGVSDANGNALDGEWTNPAAGVAGGADTFPSGNGTAGGDFRFQLNVLPGDVNRSGGSVLGSDVTLTRNAQNSTPGAPNSLYTIFKDVNGSGSILGSDVTLVRNRQGTSLPPAEPAAPVGDASFAHWASGTPASTDNGTTSLLNEPYIQPSLLPDVRTHV